MTTMTTPTLTLDELRSARSINDLPTMQLLLERQRRLIAEVEALRPLAQEGTANPYQLGKLAEQRAPVEEALKQARARVTEEEKRLRTEIAALLQPPIDEALSKVIKALKPVQPLDEELREWERLRNRFVPNYYSATRSVDVARLLKQCQQFLSR